MNLDKLLETGDRCIHKEPPTCTAQCPVHLEIIDFLAEIEKGNLTNALQRYNGSLGKSKYSDKVLNNMNKYLKLLSFNSLASIE